jgi:hypothetical protein
MRQKDREKFVRLANKRVNRAIKTIELIGNLSNKSNYDYTPDDVRAIFDTLSDQLKRCRERFEQAGSNNDVSFHLD